MKPRRYSRHGWPGGATVLALVVAAVGGWTLASLRLLSGAQATADDAWPPKIDVRKLIDGDRETGEVLVNDRVVIQIRGATEELTAYERAVIVAERLKAQIRPQNQMQVGTGLRDEQHVVLVNGATIVTIVPSDVPDGKTARELAAQWAAAIAEAMGLELTPPEEPRPWQPDEPYEDKIVPIISLGKGKQIGAARVNGPATAVAQTQAVVQIEARLLKWFDVQVYVPVSTKKPGKSLDRVQGVAVTALGDYRL